ncbi:sensor domain-containing diguanylate cyclase [Pseudomonas protegens]|jgi:diguanylate cyclase (GGDEF)-like protein|uniref:GAF domain/diguanylate cyclase domain protein n=2 Tax=Pseudomonas protegens TaxID=380021 RepID=Q4KBH0_PSEF5|nr:sensor domain-containing diguanylate cyclase [Pseudomonas protegens]AAY92577.1 GAF domain/diguanylate cyclase domain protein [Pseudomonas protegens Pf-5]ASE23234.1 sensor domain-containing diguanylate cyclase [Pseudomonas protegens]MCU1765168.1 sensor domain-containing diguanylate cyclase [Pseudomonas protegens]QEZ53085.1 sensor domain-containing diguanylate cyclase [Pseudomonas protegens]QEZ60708.1 sensor domain-containing diguanylate cyclase [Pseudomonas protegens]
MLYPSKPNNEALRIQTLRELNVLDTSPEERFDRLTRLAKRLFNVPIALVSLVDADRQWFKSCVGLDVSETSRDISFCGHAILGDQILTVPDAGLDERFHDNPLVVGAPGIRFYAGCPLTVTNGSKLGTLCLIDIKPRDLDDEDRALLRDLARMAEQELAAVQMASMDELTLLSNRRGFEALARHALGVCKRLEKPATLLFFDLNDFKQINDTYGHAEGDGALKTFADVLRIAFRESDVIGRLGGDEFVALLTAADHVETSAIMARLREILDERNATLKRGYDIRFSVGQIEYDAERHPDIEALLADADKAMYLHKQASKRAR